MSNKKPYDRAEAHAVLDALAESIERDSDEELLADASEAGEEPSAVLQEVQNLLNSALSETLRRRRAAMRSAYEHELVKLSGLPVRIPSTIEEKRTLLMNVIASQPGLQSLLTTQFRDYKDLPEEDLDSYLEELVALGVVRMKEDDPNSES